MNHKTVSNLEENNIQKKMIAHKENAMKYLKKWKDKKSISALLTSVATLIAVGLGVYLFIYSLCKND